MSQRHNHFFALFAVIDGQFYLNQFVIILKRVQALPLHRQMAVACDGDYGIQASGRWCGSVFGFGA